jgi:hypothetical protein
MRRRVIAAIGALVLSLVSVSGAVLAGGWAVTSMEGVPAEFEAGQAYTLTYTIRQHGERPVDVDETFISASSATAGSLTFPGQPTGQTGVYTAEVRFPTAATWEWEVLQGPFGPQSLGTVTVTAPAAAAGSSGSFWTSDFARFALPAGALAFVVLFVLQGARLARDRREPAIEGVVPAGQAGD